MAVDEKLVKDLKAKAAQLRKDMYKTTQKIGYAHLGGGNSMMDLTVALYYDFLNWSPETMDDPDRDRFVLSKGHCGHVLYNILVDKGVYTKEDLWNGYNKIGSIFGMHPNFRYIKGLEASTGSLGHGLPLALGMALAGRADKKNYRVFCMCGDAEMAEGSNWEAMMAAAKYQLGNLVLIIDNNKNTCTGPTDVVMPLGDIEAKAQSFGWETFRINGHDMRQILETLHSLPASDSQTPAKPICIIADTIKGKTLFPPLEGSFMSHLFFVQDDATYEALCGLVDAAEAE